MASERSHEDSSPVLFTFSNDHELFTSLIAFLLKVSGLQSQGTMATVVFSQESYEVREPYACSTEPDAGVLHSSLDNQGKDPHFN